MEKISYSKLELTAKNPEFSLEKPNLIVNSDYFAEFSAATYNYVLTLKQQLSH